VKKEKILPAEDREERCRGCIHNRRPECGVDFCWLPRCVPQLFGDPSRGKEAERNEHRRKGWSILKRNRHRDSLPEH